MSVFHPDKDPIGVWLFKWLFLPLITIGSVVWLVHFEVMKQRCQRMAEERGYIEATYSPPNSAGFGAQCICRKKRNPDGRIDETAKLVIDLD